MFKIKITADSFAAFASIHFLQCDGFSGESNFFRDFIQRLIRIFRCNVIFCIYVESITCGRVNFITETSVLNGFETTDEIFYSVVDQ